MVECAIVLDGGSGVGSAAPLMAQLERLVPGSLMAVPVGDLSERLTELAALVERSSGPVLLVDARYTGHDSPLVDVLGDPRSASAVLVGPDGESWPVLLTHGVVQSAGSQLHEVQDPTGRAGAVLRIAAADRGKTVAALRMMATVVAHASGPLLPVVLVTMARAGIRVHAVPVRAFVAAVPVGDEDRRAAHGRVAHSDEHRIRLVGAARESDGFYSTFVVRRLSRPATALALRLGVTPNQVTLVSLGVAALAAGAFATGEPAWLVLGAILLQVSLVIDCVDGELARYTRQHSALGAWLDAGTDRVKEFGVYAALAYGAARSGDQVWLLAAAVLALQVVRHFVDFGFAVRQTERIRVESTPYRVPFSEGSDAISHIMGSAAPSGLAARVGRSVADVSESTNRVRALVWLKRVVIMPIGERWLLLSVGTAVFGPRVALSLLLGLGTVAAAYTTTGRVLRSFAGTARTDRGAGDLLLMTDLGLLDGWVRPGAFAGRFAWLAPAASRTVEYGVVVLLAGVVVTGLDAVAFGCLFALSLWHYDTVYRLRFIGQQPPLVARRTVLGAPARAAVVAACALLGGAGLNAALFGLGSLVLLVTLVDSARAWSSWIRGQSKAFVVRRFTVVGAS